MLDFNIGCLFAAYILFAQFCQERLPWPTQTLVPGISELSYIDVVIRSTIRVTKCFSVIPVHDVVFLSGYFVT